ncbi:MAG: site-specific DNA-methyltransferase [Clostridia bacterium]|nr:site-specific DNA-methyltransferase [Clostridia bacterium]
MPTLDWIGKDKVVNHHLDVPFRTLEKQYTFASEGQDDGGNMIIHGDNLDALKALLPQFEGRVKCIYIDPPYNTGNEGWKYNDNVSDPRIRKWLGEVVGKEGEDLSRHDKWLCMMYPRLKLLHKLLAEDGVIFISIDDNEYANLKVICDEIFGINCFISNVSWQRTYSSRNDSKGIANEVEHILVYSKVANWNPKKLSRTESMDERYSSPDNDPRLWKAGDASAPGAATHPGMVYAIQHPITGKYIYPPNGRCWTYGQEQMLYIMQQWADYKLVPLDDYRTRVEICGQTTTVPETIPAIVLVNPSKETFHQSQMRYNEGTWPILYFTSKGRGGIACKRYLEEMGGRIVTNLWSHDEVGHTDEAAKELKNIFDGKTPFDTPKPERLVARIMQIATDPDSIILDSFAGSGTTAHAVLNMNKQDGGHRKFILVEKMDYADTITAERVRRVISGYGEGKKAVPGTGGGFSYYELGEPLLVDGLLNPNVEESKIREYVYYTETRQPMPEPSAEEKHLLGVHDCHAYYFYYEPDQLTTLNKAFLRTIKTRAESYLIYADVNTLSTEEMERFRISFKKIPRDIALL